jgi:hypothetical protein
VHNVKVCCLKFVIEGLRLRFKRQFCLILVGPHNSKVFTPSFVLYMFAKKCISSVFVFYY